MGLGSDHDPIRRSLPARFVFLRKGVRECRKELLVLGRLDFGLGIGIGKDRHGLSTIDGSTILAGYRVASGRYGEQPTTVGREAIAGHSEVHARTAQAVIQAAEIIGYRESELADADDLTIEDARDPGQDEREERACMFSLEQAAHLLEDGHTIVLLRKSLDLAVEGLDRIRDRVDAGDLGKW